MRLLLAAALVCAASASATASQELCGAAFDGNFEAVKKSIRDGADIDYPCLGNDVQLASRRLISA